MLGAFNTDIWKNYVYYFFDHKYPPYLFIEFLLLEYYTSWISLCFSHLFSPIFYLLVFLLLFGKFL